ncbi:erythropoietin [Orycteropus afer afer]|uniref:Erythropoietin n=1 Tax=Orycteropus afer afer TaxID=1230840 RepID=A0A8B7B1N3_ORYAF|nr:erythropoietin [Orycteropus afer afer]
MCPSPARPRSALLAGPGVQPNARPAAFHSPDPGVFPADPSRTRACSSRRSRPRQAPDPGVLPPALTPGGPHLRRPLTHTPSPPPPPAHAHMLITAPTPGGSRSPRANPGRSLRRAFFPDPGGRDVPAPPARRPPPPSQSSWPCYPDSPARLLLLPFLVVPLGLLVLGSPPRLICDSQVLERYILEAKEAENDTMGCAEECSLSENITVPDTKVNFYAWNRMEVSQQAMEVWQGLALLSEAILQGQALLVNSSQPLESWRLHVDKAISGLRSLTSLLRALGTQKEAVSVPGTASAAPLRTFTVDTLCKLFRVYANFLRGKLKLYTGEACRRGDR